MAIVVGTSKEIQEQLWESFPRQAEESGSRVHRMEPGVKPVMTTNDWHWGIMLAPPVLWFYRTLQWDPDDEQYNAGVTFIELAIEFFVRTRVRPQAIGDEEPYDLWRWGQNFAAMSRKMERLAKTTFWPGKQLPRVGTLRTLGMKQFIGLQFRPKLQHAHCMVRHITAHKDDDRYDSGRFVIEWKSLPPESWKQPAERQPEQTPSTSSSSSSGPRRRLNKKTKPSETAVRGRAAVMQPVAEDEETVTYNRGSNLGCSSWANRDELRPGDVEAGRAQGLKNHALEWELKRLIHNRKAQEKDWHVIVFVGNRWNDKQPLQCEHCRSRWTTNAWRIITRGQQCAARGETEAEKNFEDMNPKERKIWRERTERQVAKVEEYNKHAKAKGKHLVIASNRNWKAEGWAPVLKCKVCQCTSVQTGMRKLLSNSCSGSRS